jgi:hypothetical protein
MLTQAKAEKVTKPGRHPVDDNLFLCVRKSGAKSFVFRYQIPSDQTTEKRKRKMIDRSLGLGPFPLVSVLEAKEKALEARKNIFNGLDPIDQKKELAAEKARAATGTKTFREAAIAYGETTSVKWTRKVADEFHQRMTDYVYPTIGSVAVKSIDRALILNCLSPIWSKKYSVAKNVRRDIARVLAFAKGHGWRSGDDPTEFIDDVLPNLDHTAGHRKALPFVEMYAFMKKLAAIEEDTTARGAEFCILTATRKMAAQEARWSEIDFENKRWTIPKERRGMKRKAHTVPLAPRVLELLRCRVRKGMTACSSP